MRLNNIISANVANAAAMPISQNHRLPAGMLNNNTAVITPNAVPELMPSSSGLAIGFCVSRCSNTPVVASMMPQAAAVNRRG